MDNEHIIKEFRSYVDGFVECCTSDHETHELLKAVDKLIEEQEERIAIMEEGCHIDMIRELLAKYGEAESTKIWEHSGDIDGDQAELDAELAEYRRRAGIEPRKEGEQYETTDL